MLLIVGIVAIVVFTYQVYKTAGNTERNPGLWAVITAVIGIGFQFVLPLIIGIVLAVYYLATGTPADQLESEIYGIAVVFNIVCLILSIAGMVLVMKHVSKVKDIIPLASAGPPPPPSFG